MKSKLILLAPTVLLIAACGNSSTESSKDAPTPAESSPPGHGYEHALERAHDVNQVILDAAQRQREQIEEQEGGG